MQRSNKQASAANLSGTNALFEATSMAQEIDGGELK
jgi:hypothetical protein